MAQSSVLFAAAKTKMKQKNAVSQNDLSRLMEATNYENAMQILVDIGFANNTNEDYEIVADKYISDACIFVNRYSPNKDVTDIMLYNYDGHNLKVLFKARLLNVEACDLYTCGTIDLGKMRHAIINHNYSFLPEELKKCMDSLEKLSVTGVEPFMIDAKIDKAIFELIFQKLKTSKNRFLLKYFMKKVTFINTVMTLRLKEMNKKAETLNELLIDNGMIDKTKFLKYFSNPSKLHWPLILADKEFASAFMLYINGQISLAKLEVVADNALLHMFKKYTYSPLNIEAVIAYIISTQRQASVIRLIMAGKASGTSTDIIKESMRAIYAK